MAISEVDIYDPDADRWTSVGALAHGPGERYVHSATRLQDGRLLIAGGKRPAEGKNRPPALLDSATLRLR